MPEITNRVIDATLAEISSENPERRRDGWQRMRDHSAAYRAALTNDHMYYLQQALDAEKDSATFVIALKVCVALALHPSRVIKESGSPDVEKRIPDRVTAENPRLLVDWLWEPFREPSAVLGVTATNYIRRDEGALLWLGRRLSFADYRTTEFPKVSLEHPDLDGLLFDGRYKAIGVVGRLGLFGKTALKQLGGDDLQFGFDLPRRPENYTTGKLDNKYHRIYERTDSPRKKYHLTKENSSFRTDFAVVQRYLVKLGNNHVVIVIVAGASSLGTVAAAQWAAYDLFQSNDALEMKPIETPPHITPHSRMEALLRVKAKITTSAWEHPEIELQQLHVDDASWSPKDKKWHTPPIQVITMVCRGNVPIHFLFDDQPARLEPGKQSFRLLAAIVDQVRRQGNGRLDLTALAANNMIWDKSNPTLKYVRAQLRLLKTRHLKDAIRTRGESELLALVDVQ